MFTKHIHKIIIIWLVLFLTLFTRPVIAGQVSNFSVEISSQLIASAANYTVAFTTSSAFSPAETLAIVFAPGFDLTDIDYTDIDLQKIVSSSPINLNLGASPGSGVGSNIGVNISNQKIVFTQNDTDTISTGTQIIIKIGLLAEHQIQGDNQIYNPANAATYNINLGGNFGDLGSLAIQILETDTVMLLGSVTPELNFKLRNSDDTADGAPCFLGMLVANSISQCSFRLVAETNLASGFQIWFNSDGALRGPQGELSPVTEDTQVIPGIESSGLSLTAASNLIEEGIFNDDDSPIPTVSTLLLSSNFVYNYIQGDLSTSSLLTLKVAVSSLTKPGAYGQILTFSILGNY